MVLQGVKYGVELVFIFCFAMVAERNAVFSGRVRKMGEKQIFGLSIKSASVV